jgi:DNA-binding response OmpR family regulator
MTMPVMSGKEMVRLIDRGQQPDFRVLYMSGYDDSVGLGIDLLQKPFTSADLLQRVRDALGRSQHTTTA